MAARARWVGALAAGTALVAGSFVAPTAGAGTPSVVAGPNAQSVGFAPNTVVTFKGSAVDFVNADLNPHNVTSKLRVRISPKTRATRPLFASKTVGPGKVTAIVGVEKLKPGTYEFFCSMHTGMIGKLVVR